MAVRFGCVATGILRNVTSTMTNLPAPWNLLRHADRKRLLSVDPAELLGSIIQLNRSHYQNRLDALALMVWITEQRPLRRAVARR